MNSLRRLLVVAVGVAVALPPMPAGAAVQIESTAFTSATEGYIAGGSSVTNGPRNGFVSRTTDGGITWQATRIPNRWLTGISAYGQQAWVTSMFFPYVFRTADSGATWQQAGSPTASGADLARVLRLDSGRILAAGLRRDTPNGTPALIASSDDAGVSWTTRLEGPLYEAKGESEYPPPTRAAVADLVQAGGTAWALANEWTDGGLTMAYKRRLVWKSTDGFSTLTTKTVPAHVNSRMLTAAAAAGSAVYFFGESRLVSSKGRLQYLKSADAGETWSALEMPPIEGLREVNARDAVAIDANRVVVVGGARRTSTAPYTGIVLWTTDGGATWNNIQLPDVPSLRAVAAPTPTQWFVTGGNEVLLRTTDAGATWTGQRGPMAPRVTLSSPAAGFGLSAMPVPVSGTASDTGVGVAAVEVRIRRGDGKYWDGAGWAAGETWLTAATTDGWRTWRFSWSPDAETLALRVGVTLSVVAVDGCGNRSAARVATSAGKVAATVGTPTGVPSVAVRNRTYAVSGTLSPRHAVGSRAIRIAAQRRERTAAGTYQWRTRKTVSGSIGRDYRYRGSISLPSAGQWRLQAYHPADAAHLTSFSGYRYTTVR